MTKLEIVQVWKKPLAMAVLAAVGNGRGHSG